MYQIERVERLFAINHKLDTELRTGVTRGWETRYRHIGAVHNHPTTLLIRSGLGRSVSDRSLYVVNHLINMRCTTNPSHRKIYDL